MYACMYVCMYIYIYVCVCVCVCVYKLYNTSEFNKLVLQYKKSKHIIIIVFKYCYFWYCIIYKYFNAFFNVFICIRMLWLRN